ncbi:uncharacterized protein LOC118733209 [Rhagoletis pomonella]|uniref:uncharacterized protein LOC118733209 n=1 Tax=Rhagoletis pomonella TaxID=28610 RepID=UPI00177CE476|nr:uncharacterized protein LOC118733209 [Rhagoletis pomonella]
MGNFNYSANNVFNVDETGISVVPSKLPQVLSRKGKRQIGSLTSGERGSTITTIVCMSAGGIFVPPLFIIPRKKRSDLLKGAPPESIYECHQSGWVQTYIFTIWFRHFIKHVKPSAASPVLLVLDGDSSHTSNIELVDLARENHVSIVSIPPHSSHKIQPLDKTFMGPLKSYLSEEIRVWMRSNGRALTPFDMAELYGKAYLRVHSGKIAINGFRTTDIFPLNRYIFRDDEFLAADDVASHSPPREYESTYEVPEEILNNEIIVECPHPINDICNGNLNRSVLSESNRRQNIDSNEPSTSKGIIKKLNFAKEKCTAPKKHQDNSSQPNTSKALMKKINSERKMCRKREENKFLILFGLG